MVAPAHFGVPTKYDGKELERLMYFEFSLFAVS